MNCPTCGIDIDQHPANRCMDAWVAEKVMGWKPQPCCHDEHYRCDGEWGSTSLDRVDGCYFHMPCHNMTKPKPYSTDWGAMGEVLEHFTDDGTYATLNRGTVGGLGCPVVKLWHACLSSGGYGRWGKADTAPLAVCRAAIKASA